MRKIVLYIASSLDGFIADRNNEIAWLTSFHGDYGYHDFLKTVDTVLSGRKTYDAVVAMSVPDSHPRQMNYIFTAAPERYQSTANMLFTSQDPIELAEELRKQNGKDIFLVGGGELIVRFLEHRMIDEIILFIVPTLLCEGVPLFRKHETQTEYSTVSVNKYDDGMIELRLVKK